MDDYLESFTSRIDASISFRDYGNCISLVGYTAMAGIIGAGGLGTLAFLDGFQRSREDVTLVATILILIIRLYHPMDWRYNYN